MSILIVLVLLCLVIAITGICATVSYLRLRDFSSCAVPQPEPQNTFQYSRASCSTHRSNTVLQTILAAQAAAENRRANTTVQLRTWSDIQRFHRQMSSRLDAICRGSDARLHGTTVDVTWEPDQAASGA